MTQNEWSDVIFGKKKKIYHVINIISVIAKVQMLLELKSE